MIYFDNAATTAPDKAVISEAEDFLQNCFANPSSVHSLGYEAEMRLEKARKKVAAALGADPKQLFFTSGGTEANNTAVLGAAEAKKRRGKRVITQVTEHPSVADAFNELEKRGFEVIRVNVDKKGRVCEQELLSAVNEETTLVSVMNINNEFGTIQPVNELAEKVKKINPETLFHSDCVQAFGKHPVNIKNLDLVTVSAHKIHALKGVGALYVKKGTLIKPLHFGGGQEGAFRPGTENTVGIVAFGAAAELAAKQMQENFQKVTSVKNELLKITQMLDNVWINGDQEGSPYILNLGFEGVKGEVLVHALEDREIYCSTGSACSSRVKEKKKLADLLVDGTGSSALRIGIGKDNTEQQARQLTEALCEIVPMLRKYRPR